MNTQPGNHLNSRKPFKLLAHFDAKELSLLHLELTHYATGYPGKLYAKLLIYFNRWQELQGNPIPMTRENFIANTSLPTSPNAFDKLTSHFYNFLQEFLARQELLSDPLHIQQLAFRAYIKKDFEWKEIRRRYKEASRELDKLPQTSRLLHERLAFDLDLTRKSTYRNIASSERGFELLLETLEADYVTQKLRILCAIANDQKIFASPTPNQESLQSMLPFRNTWPTLAKLYFEVYQLLTGAEEKNFMKRLQGLLDQQQVDSSGYPQEDMLDLYGFLLNALARKVNKGLPGTLKDLNLLYDHLLGNGALLIEGKMHSNHFKNIISVKLKCGNVQDARNCFDEFKDKIRDDSEQNVVRYNHTLILYAEQHLELAAQELEALCNLTGDQKLDLFYGLDMRANLLKIYFDLLDKAQDTPILWDETDEKLTRLLESFKGYIVRKKLPGRRKNSYEHFRKHLKSLYSLTYRREPQTDANELSVLKEEIQNSPEGEDPWFIDRLKKIEEYLGA